MCVVSDGSFDFNWNVNILETPHEQTQSIHTLKSFLICEFGSISLRSLINSVLLKKSEKMLLKLLLRIFIIIQLVSCAFLESLPDESTSYPIKVLAIPFPPFTYFNSDHGFYGGIDILILRTIAKRLNLKIIFTKANDTNWIAVHDLE